MKEHQNAIHMSYRSLLGLQAIQNAYVKRNKALADPAHRGFASHPRVEWPTSRGPRTTPKPGQAAEPIIGKVGILGAGAAGLYAAMILQSMGIDYEILEAQNVPGGRLHTHYFEPGANASNNYGNFQYYDVGAMRSS